MRLIDGDALQEEYVRLSGRKLSLIEDAPTINAVPVRHGYWKGKPIAGYSDVRCSQCGDVFMENSGNWNYCPNCGAKMEKNL